MTNQTSIAQSGVRRLAADDRRHFEAHLKRLDMQSRRSRFGAAVSELFLDEYSGAALAAEGVIYGYFIDGELRAVGELRDLSGDAVGPIDNDVSCEAEAACSVEETWRRRGLASELFDRILDAAGDRRIMMTCLPSNDGARALMRKLDADIIRLAPDVLGVVTPHSRH